MSVCIQDTGFIVDLYNYAWFIGLGISSLVYYVLMFRRRILMIPIYVADVLVRDEIRQNFSELHKPLTELQAIQESARCLFCHDAPCTEACPTGYRYSGVYPQNRQWQRERRGQNHTQRKHHG